MARAIRFCRTFCTLHKLKSTRPRENSTRNACNSRMAVCNTCYCRMALCFLTDITCKKVWHKSYTSGHWPTAYGTEPVSALTLALFYCSATALYNFCFFCLCSLQILFFLGFRQWRSRAESVAESYILTQPSDFHCFGELELGPRQALAHMCWPVAIHKGRDYRNCRASELSNCQVSGLVFSWFTKLSKIQKKWRHCKRRF